ncbi:unnamed protein product [Didymodactylos carnosus]|uniref:Phage tail collar domain-containing protein n=1 Tax=Didymodactylos carnosus TaxID=1234261 RepID=A0A813X8J9_9BILA|nr:unnamed protein product [Didymodactylos carnosus]CAF0866921.1 unnamed protein product [Didymodactylos carnosus]CAF3499642.1 unnamed protein product [Didymodactylos carnosus]CAF3654404.1 unnamed protein product [Didymodactylos carnosus]
MWSPYDLNPDRITEELSKMFTYNDTETKRRNSTSLYYDFNKVNMNEHANSHAAKAGASVSAEAHLSVPFGSGGAKVSASAYGETADSSSGSLYNQLNETTNNQFSSDDIKRMFTQQGTELQFKGEKISPKSFQVYKLSDLTDQVQVGIISKQLIAEKKDGAIVRTISALNFPVPPPIAESTTTTTTSIPSTTTTISISEKLLRSNMILTGEIRLYAGTQTPPAPWLICNGSAVSRNEYPNLFRAIGETYGNGDSVETFNLPDFRGRIPVGVDEFGERVKMAGVCGMEGGNSTYSLTTDELPAHVHSHGTLSASTSGSHTHSIIDPGHDHGGSTGESQFGSGNWEMKGSRGHGKDDIKHSHSIPKGRTYITINADGNHGHTINGKTGTVGAGKEFSLMPPFQTVNYIIYSL